MCSIDILNLKIEKHKTRPCRAMPRLSPRHDPWLGWAGPSPVTTVLGYGLTGRPDPFGLRPHFGLFGQVVSVVACLSQEKVAAKLELFKRTIGYSGFEVFTAVSKAPAILKFSAEILLRKIGFLVIEAALEPRYIVQRPVLLTYSLEKRLVPRHCVMKVLWEKGLLNSNSNFFTVIKLGEETFRSKFIDCHKDSVPGLAYSYATTRAGIVPSRVYYV
uniref:Uncharacterized protein n=1 Tax=Zea mays TaxID=4577 RepID=A0A804M6F8_MAIZE